MNVFSNRASGSYSTATLLLIAVNIPLAMLVVVMALLDYQMEMNRATGERKEVLIEQASLIGNALLSIGESPNSQNSERFIVKSSENAGRNVRIQRWIDVTWNDQSIQYHAASDSTIVSRLASKPNATIADESADKVVVGRFESGPLIIEVSELAVDIRRSTRNEIVIHLLGLLGLATFAAILVNFALVRLIARPAQSLCDAVARIRNDRLAVPKIDCLSRELNTLGELIAEMSESLALADRKRALDMKRAEEIQQHLLPKSPAVPGLAISTHFQPAEDVAGDIYGVVSMPDDSWLIYITDLVGHGVPAAMNASILKMLFDTSAVRGGNPGEVLQRVNEMLPGYLMDSEFATAAVLRWEPATGRLQFASAGHEPVLLLTESCVESLGATGLPLGIDRESHWETTEHCLRPGDRMLMVTDGVAESHDVEDKQFGRDQVSAMFANSFGESLDDFVKRLVCRVQQHCGATTQDDDVTVLSIECRSIDKEKTDFSHLHHLKSLREAVA